MIYQFYFAKNQENRLFKNPIYKSFGLTAEVNENIKNIPILLDKAINKALVEFGGMLYLWQFPPDDNDDWIGFTSYRQLDKTWTIFHDANVIKTLLDKFDFITWLNLWHGGMSVMGYAEQEHPGINGYLQRSLWAVKTHMPHKIFTIERGCYASYWAMKKSTFHDFMKWLYPHILYGVAKLKSDSYLMSNEKALGYALERMFIIWYLIFDKSYCYV